MVASYGGELRICAQATAKSLPWQARVFVTLTGIMLLVRRQVRQWAAAGETVSAASSVLNRPYAAALIFPSLCISLPYSAVPAALRDLVRVLAFLPVIRLTRPAVEPRLVSALYVQAVLFALDTVRQGYAGSRGPEQALLALEMLAGIGVLGYSLLAHRWWREHAWVTDRLRLIRVIAGIVLFALGVGLTADMFGSLRLSRLLASSLLGSGALALTLYASLRVLVGATAVALRVWPLRLLQMVQHHRDLLERRTHTVLSWVATIGWLGRTLDYVGLLQPALPALAALARPVGP